MHELEFGGESAPALAYMSVRYKCRVCQRTCAKSFFFPRNFGHVDVCVCGHTQTTHFSFTMNLARNFAFRCFACCWIASSFNTFVCQ